MMKPNTRQRSDTNLVSCYRSKQQRKKTVRIVLALWAVLPLMVLICLFFHLRFTYTGSLPVGFYRAVSAPLAVARGDIIAFCLPKSVATVGREAGYLPSGHCPAKSGIVMKAVIALPGDRVYLSEQGIKVNKAFYFAPRHVKDKQGKWVKRFIAPGRYVATGVWVYGFASPHYSWDSRYYGAIPIANIVTKLVPLWLF